MKTKRIGKNLAGSYGKCSICKKPIKHGEQWHFVEIPNNTTTGKTRQHYDCKNPTRVY